MREAKKTIRELERKSEVLERKYTEAAAEIERLRQLSHPQEDNNQQ